MALNRGRHLYSARWALAHILVLFSFSFTERNAIILVVISVLVIKITPLSDGDGHETTQHYLVRTESHQWRGNVESSLWSNIPVTADVESIDKHYSFPPALQTHTITASNVSLPYVVWLLCCKLLRTRAEEPT